jgi:hypothetical protein
MLWTKPNGNEIETNDEKATVEYCESLGWKRAEKPKKKRSVKKSAEKK